VSSIFVSVHQLVFLDILFLTAYFNQLVVHSYFAGWLMLPELKFMKLCFAKSENSIMSMLIFLARASKWPSY